MSDITPITGEPLLHVAEVLSSCKPMKIKAIVEGSMALGSTRTQRSLSYSLNSLAHSGHAVYNREKKVWMLTKQGRLAWQMHLLSKAQAKTQPDAKPTPMLPAGDTALLVRNVSRFATNTTSHFAMRAGAMDHAQHPRIQGGYRVWPCGRREPLNPTRSTTGTEES